ncbi:CMD domain-containing protein [Klebsiella aerogenes]|uniref:CMD domain-containing protein n=1 Tax=Klebsiella aerogenes TaxID=548 RepID=UPI00190EAFA7|nr:carboxymuconolactone decarboxylase family protein [Klebsiella aerogenes]MBK0697141.1 CMD domain-containing protein [Klebsiella aerogenes]
MEQRRVYGKNHWYHETQSTNSPVEVLPLVPEAADVDDRFLLDLPLAADLSHPHKGWLAPARQLAKILFPDSVTVTRLQTFSAYDRLSTALTVAQVYGVQRLCNHYAARLAPLPGPDSSRESNRRLAQITQYARQLASSPSVINEISRRQLEEVGLTSRDIVLINQIIGFVGFQARAVATFQAALGQPVRWLPGMPQQDDAPAEHFTEATGEWSPDIDDADMRYANDDRQARLAAWNRHPGLKPLAPLLASDEDTLALLHQLLTELDSSAQPLSEMAALLAARINGSVSCFNAWAARWTGDNALLQALRGDERTVQHWTRSHPLEHVFLQAAQLLTRAPDRFSAAQLTPLTEYGLSRVEAIDLLTWCGLCGWLNRLKIALGVVRQAT